MGIAGDARTWNILLFRLRKAGQLADLETTKRTSISWADCDEYLFASEIALQMLLDADRAESIDEILCDPSLCEEFDAIAARFAPGRKPLEYRWAALKLRKQAKVARSRGAVLAAPSRLGRSIPVDELDLPNLHERPGVYVLSGAGNTRLYVGEALSLRRRLSRQFDHDRQAVWAEISPKLQVQIFATQTLPADMLAWQSCLVSKYKPRMNLKDLAATS